MSQLDLTYTYRGADPSDLARAHNAVSQAVVELGGLKEVAHALDVAPSQLAHAIAQRDRHYVRLGWVVHLLRNDRNGTLIAALADIARYDVKPRQPLTDGERLARLEGALSALPETVRTAIYREARLK